MSLFPQVVHSQNLPEQAPAPIERRVLTIIVDGAASANPPAGSRTLAAAAAPTARPLEPLPTAAPPVGTPVSPLAAASPAPAASAIHAMPADWVADALRTPMAAGEGWRIQVGAFRDAARADAHIAALEMVAAGPGADPIRLVVPAGDVYRAQMSGFADRAAADGACARIAATGQACFAVEPQS